ncbi:2-hydroxychromene-2-carboxylate isomerase [Parasphingorhabdus marina DSM 22363]|uniref:2-hydroxychromene-2-carboxylate isomerase n=1 Tax=Parasphingorhabdus marina DSM 22363 TaxID=1123272 RepID=A0A1N6HSN7_9SPHN|nr:DsbA family protein [Parasphingorhabdus marina]SIO22807.1 2-hydroxychromene-2-carboxylate isomerase [Parasphingorhabdus marina DSM 22363]
MLTVHVDFKSPAAWLAIGPTQALADRHDAPIDWRAFPVFERPIPDLPEKASIGETHRKVRAESRRRIFSKYAALQRLELQFPDEPKGTELALGALELISGDRTAYVEAAFTAYWQDRADLDDPATVTSLIAQSVAEPFAADPGQCAMALATATEAAEALGVVDAPAYCIADQLFIGREHLPWIGELLASEG